MSQISKNFLVFVLLLILRYHFAEGGWAKKTTTTKAPVTEAPVTTETEAPASTETTSTEETSTNARTEEPSTAEAKATAEAPSTTEAKATTEAPASTKAPTETTDQKKELDLWKEFIGEIKIPGLVVKSCGGLIYDSYSQHCCGGEIYNRIPFRSCCGGTIYDSLSHICKDDEVKARSNTCRNRTYNLKKKFCFNNKLYKIVNAVVCDGAVHRFIEN